jgi:hypothetical protein
VLGRSALFGAFISWAMTGRAHLRVRRQLLPTRPRLVRRQRRGLLPLPFVAPPRPSCPSAPCQGGVRRARPGRVRPMVLTRSRFLPEYKWMPRDEHGNIVIAKHLLTSVFQQRREWARLIPMDGVTRAIVNGMACYPRIIGCHGRRSPRGSSILRARTILRPWPRSGTSSGNGSTKATSSGYRTAPPGCSF